MKKNFTMAGLLLMAVAAGPNLSWAEAGFGRDQSMDAGAAWNEAREKTGQTSPVPEQRPGAACSCADHAVDAEFAAAAGAPFTLYYVGRETAGGKEKFMLEKISKLGDQPHFYYRKESQFECISGDYDSAAPYVALLAKLFLQKRQIKTVNSAGMRADHILAIDADYESTVCPADTEGDDGRPGVVNGHLDDTNPEFPVYVCDHPTTAIRRAVLTYPPCPTENVFYYGGEPKDPPNCPKK